MRKVLVLLAVAGFSIPGFSQQDPQFSQNQNNRLFPNPGVAGSNNAICATLLGRNQWVGFDGRPETYLLSVHAPVPVIYGGVGLSVYSDQLGQESTFGAKLAYAFRTSKLGPGDLGVGVGLGFINKSLNSNWRSTDPFAQDDVIPDNGAGDTGFDMDFGIYYEIQNKLYFGLSTTHLMETQIQDSYETPTSVSDVDLNYRVSRHYYVMAGYDHAINAEWDLKPSVFVKSDALSTQVDVNVSVLYNKLVWGGVSYRLQDAIIPMVGINYQAPGKGAAGGLFKFGYSYDVTTSLIRQHSSGSHEIMLNYCFNIPRNPKPTIHRTVRFL